MNRKYLLTTSIMVLMLANVTGCSKQETASVNAALSIEDEANENTILPSQIEETKDIISNSPISDNKGDATSDVTDTSSKSDNNTSSTSPINVNQNTIIIGGKVRSVAQDSFVISRTLWEDSDDGGSYVSIPEEGSPEEDLVTIHCTETTTFERWTIQGGGAGITTDETAFSDIQRGSGLEAEGYFDGEEFIAERVIIEIYE
ncbi:MAG: hypothetical protein HDR09_10530 [Lachnospiraceae bacterium]|nr:hypothetical protein [Lachnospiraceae bacterium]